MLDVAWHERCGGLVAGLRLLVETAAVMTARRRPVAFPRERFTAGIGTATLDPFHRATLPNNESGKSFTRREIHPPDIRWQFLVERGGFTSSALFIRRGLLHH